MSLFKWQSISFLSRLMALVLGIIQSFVIINVLPLNEYGAVKVVASIASLIGVSQALGITSASTREISGAKNKTDASKIFLTSLILRNLISIPFVIGLFLLAPLLAANRTESFDNVVWALRVLSITLIIQTSQGVFNSVLSAYQKFKIIFLFQVFIAVVSIFLYIPLVYFYGFKGYYLAYLFFNITSCCILAILALKQLKFVQITVSELYSISKSIFSISITIYVTKLLYTFWIDGPILFLEYIKEEKFVIPIFSFALLYTTKLSVFSDSITDVTLPVMSKKFAQNIDEFKNSYKLNFSKTFVIITFVASFASFWSGEVVKLFIKREYYEAIFVIPLIMLGIWAYSNVDLLKSSIFVPAKKLKNMVYVYLTMPIIHYVLFYFLYNLFSNVLINFSASFGLSAVFVLLTAFFMVMRDFDIFLLNRYNIYFLGVSIFFTICFYLNLPFYIKLILSIIYIVLTLFVSKKLGLLEIFAKKIK